VARLLRQIVDLFLHLDKHLAAIIQDYGGWSYLILFLVVFLETGVVVTPFLPGDSLLFAAGALAATGGLDIGLTFLLLATAAVAGDTVNYWIGQRVGPRAFGGQIRFLKREHLIRTQEFYEKHGGKTIFLARFIPIIRTFAPFVAGIGRMSYPKFLAYNLVGGVTWVAVCLFAGFGFGNLPAVKNNFSLVLIGIVAVSLLPVAFEAIRHYRAQRAAGK
jgi:membrane-associated protein